jgi:Zn finger protein HypA/HybF involved in hydrogenase expression
MLPELQVIASRMGFAWVTRVELIVGSIHGVPADGLAEEFENAFECTSFEGAVVEVVIVRPQEEIKSPGRDDTMTTTGWEMLVRKMEGKK